MTAQRETGFLQTAQEIWDYLRTDGGLDAIYYDRDIVHDLCDKLSLPAEVDLARVLGEHSISAEDFIIAFFQAVQPYAEMMSDLLAMFEKAGAAQGSRNLAIEFNFDLDFPPLKFDLENFRQYLRTWTTATGTIDHSLWDTESLWKLCGSFGDTAWDAPVQDPDFQAWFNEYKEMGHWPDKPLAAPRSRDADLDSILSRVWRVWSSFVAACREYGANRKDVVEARYPTQEHGPHSEPLPTLNPLWPLSVLGLVESDLWAGSLARRAYHQAERVSNSPPDERTEQAALLATNLASALGEVPQRRYQIENRIELLLDFLSLPIWKQRHELYSAWISTQILKAIPDEPIRIHTSGSRLVFAFSGTHLATADAYDPRLHIWAELRSPLKDPRGKSRKKAIQPDYSLVVDPITNPESSILEVECKQYRRPSARNFADALTDYARGRPHAQVILVNYGRTSDAILQRVDETVRKRTCLIGYMHPGCDEAQERFTQIIQESIAKHFDRRSGRESPPEIIDTREPARVQLTWHEQPSDLDLYLRIDRPTHPETISYGNKGSQTAEPWSELDVDIRSGAGPETIQIVQWTAGLYHVAVNRFSKDSPLAGCGAVVNLSCGSREWMFCCPDKGTGEWWSILQVDGSTGQLIVINKISERPW